MFSNINYNFSKFNIVIEETVEHFQPQIILVIFICNLSTISTSRNSFKSFNYCNITV